MYALVVYKGSGIASSPKGGRKKIPRTQEYSETIMECAEREFVEETELSVANDLTLSESWLLDKWNAAYRIVVYNHELTGDTGAGAPPMEWSIQETEVGQKDPIVLARWTKLSEIQANLTRLGKAQREIILRGAETWLNGNVVWKPEPQVKAAEEVDCDEEQAAAMDATERVETSDNATERVELDQEDVSLCNPQTEEVLPKQTQSKPQVVAVRDERQPSKLPMEKVPVSKRLPTEPPDDDLERLVDKGDGRQHLLEKENQRRVVEEADVVQGSPTATQKETTHPHEQEVPELTEPGQQMAYVIVNAFLDNVTFENTEAETLIKQVILRIGKVIEPNMLLNIDEVFQPIFFDYPDYPNRTRGKPLDACQFIKQWQEIATWRPSGDTEDPWRDIERWRHSGDTEVSPRHATKQLAKEQVQSIMHQYIANFIDKEANDMQKGQAWNKNKSRAEAVLRKRCGSTMMAKLIWELGLPNVSPARFAMEKSLPATEQPRALTEDVRESMTRATDTILHWLSVLATSIHDHKATKEYQEHARKSGTQKHRSGLNEAELKVKEDKKRDARQKYGRQHSTASCSHTWHALAEWQWVPAQWKWRGDTGQALAQWQGHGDTWQAPAKWPWHCDTWPAKWR